MKERSEEVVAWLTNAALPDQSGEHDRHADKYLAIAARIRDLEAKLEAAEAQVAKLREVVERVVTDHYELLMPGINVRHSTIDACRAALKGGCQHNRIERRGDGRRWCLDCKIEIAPSIIADRTMRGE